MAEIIRTDVYPIRGRRSAAYRDLLRSCRAELAEDGNCILPRFLSAWAVAACQYESRRIAGAAYRPKALQNVYYTHDDPSLSASDPRRRMFRRTSGFVPADKIRPGTCLRRLFEDEDLLRFMEACRAAGPLYRYADPLGDMVLNVLEENQTLPWHFDTPDFSVTVMVQTAEAGGRFEYASKVRSPQSENFAAVGEVLDGVSKRVRSVDLQPGDLQIFHGRFSLHRVTPVIGPRPRYTAVLGYVDEPDLVARPARVKQLFGRALPIHYARQVTDGLLD